MHQPGNDRRVRGSVGDRFPPGETVEHQHELAWRAAAARRRHAPEGGVLYSRPMSGSAKDKRDAKRIEILGDLKGEVMVFSPVAIKEISRSGALVETAFPLQLDSLHDFRLTLGDRSVVVKGRVVHCSISDMDQEVVLYRSGIEFTTPPDRVNTAIAEFVDAVSDGRRAL